MKHLRILLLFIFITSCNYFNVKKTTSDEILKEELQSFKWDEVDVYPSFSVCDSLTEKQEKKQCFETTLTKHVLNEFSKEKIIVSTQINDTVIVEFKISEKGDISIFNIIVKDDTLAQIPMIKSKLITTLDSLPQIYPAIKRGQQVSTQFKLPIIIKVN